MLSKRGSRKTNLEWLSGNVRKEINCCPLEIYAAKLIPVTDRGMRAQFTHFSRVRSLATGIPLTVSK